MASFINKAKDKVEAALNSNNNKGDNPRSDNYGSHSSNVANKADPRFDSDRDNRNDPTSRVGGYGQTQAYDQHNTTGGGAGFASSDTYGSNTNNPAYDNPQSTNAGPHKSNLLNKLDPRTDSDRDGRNDPTSRVGGYGNTQHYGDNYGTAGGAGGLGTSDTGYGSSGNAGYSSGTAPVHEATTHAGHGHGHGHGHGSHAGGLAAATSTGTAGHGLGSNTHGSGINDPAYDNPRSSAAGPHSSNLLNKADPRVDSDRDHRNDPTSRVGGYGNQGESYGHSTGPTGGYTSGSTAGYGADPAGGYTTEAAGYGSTNTGTHTGGHPGAHTGSHTGAYAGNTGGVGTGYGDNYNNTPGSGNAPSTAGPHNSNILNKLDPRVDSDLDGSKTYGGNQTHR